MIYRLLQQIQEGRVHSTGELAEALGISVTLLAPMLEELAARGYVTGDAACAPEHCGGCALQAACIAGPPLKLWTLTEKGRAAAK